jgi:hypothetical protein
MGTARANGRKRAGHAKHDSAHAREQLFCVDWNQHVAIQLTQFDGGRPQSNVGFVELRT